MPRPKNIINQKHIEQIKNHAEQTFGKPLTHSFECEDLSKDIEKVTGSYVSPQTLRRLFGFLNTDFAPSLRTLNALSAYTGFSHWHSFTEQSSSAHYQALTLDQEAGLYLEFYKIDMKAEADMNYHNASRNIAFRILFNPGLLSKLTPTLAKNTVSQVYFFERFPYIDGLCTGYKRSIQLYLQKKELEAQIFGNSLLFLSAFLSRKQKELKLFLDRINANPIEKTMHPFIIARYIGSNILYEQLKQRNTDFWIAEANKWNTYFLQKVNVNFWHYPYFQHMISDYLNLAGLFKESYSIMRTINQYNKNHEIEEGYVEALEVVYQISRHPSSPDAYRKWFNTTKAFDTISPLFKKFYYLQALSVYHSLLPDSNKKAKASDKVKQLIIKTGFEVFQKYLCDTPN